MSAAKLTMVALAASVVAHAGAYLVLAKAPHSALASRPITTASFAILPKPPNAPDPEPPAAEPPRPAVPERPRPRTNAPAEAPPAPESEPTPEPATAAAAADLTGITLTNSLGTGWLSAAGDGSSRSGPLRNVEARRAAAAPVPSSSARPRAAVSTPPRAAAPVAPEDLSKPPRAPDLNGALEANYPPEARAAGISGFAVIRALISASGEARPTGIVSESAPGFGTACLRTLAGSRWSAPIDRDGNAVTTEIRYRCTFKVAR